MTKIEKTCQLCGTTKDLTDFPSKTVKNIDGNVWIGRLNNCKLCSDNIKKYQNNVSYHQKRKAMKLLKDKEMKDIDIKEEYEKVVKENVELWRQIDILIPMVHKDARKMYYEMNPEMDRFRDKNAGKPFVVVNLGTEEKVGIFTNVAMVAEELNLPAARIQACLKGRVNQVAGYTFYYDNE